MKINENQRKSTKINEVPWKSMKMKFIENSMEINENENHRKLNENQWKSMKINEIQYKSIKSNKV